MGLFDLFTKKHKEINHEEKDTFKCQKCNKVLEKKYLNKNNICEDCFSISETNKENYQDIVCLFETSIFIGKPIKLMTMFLEYNNYDIEFSDDTMTIVKYSDDPWNHFNKYIAKADGVYNYVEVQMGGYDVKKRVSCCNFETACFLTLAMFISKEKSLAQETLLLEIKKHANTVAKNSTDYWNGQFVIDELISLTK